MDQSNENGEDECGPIELAYVQQQRGDVDCGVFAIAFAAHLVLGDDVASLKFDHPRMREHLYKCLHQKKMTGFPQCAQTTARRTPRLRRTYIEFAATV